MATTATPSSWKAPVHSHSNSRSSRPLLTPRNSQPVVSSAAQMKSQLSPNLCSSQIAKDAQSPGPSYFGFAIGDNHIPGESGPGLHARGNWNDASKPSPRPTNNERNPEFELFRRQSEKNIAFALNSLPQPTSSSNTPLRPQNVESPVSPTNTISPALKDVFSSTKSPNVPQYSSTENPFFANVQRTDSPLHISSRTSVTDHKQSRLSLPAREIQESIDALKAQRSDTLPPQSVKENHALVAPQDVAQVLDQFPEKTLVLDLRVYPQYAASRIRGALNLCIPTTLLKRPAFTAQKLADTFTSEEDKTKFTKWRTAQFIVVYDATSSLAKEAITSLNVLKKFVTEGWTGRGLVVKGGFQGFQKHVPRLVDQGSSKKKGAGETVLSISPPNQDNLPVAGGCAMPSTQNAANPFFGNIRQNMDLLDGVGQISIKKPAGMTDTEEKRLPAWLRRAAQASNEGKEVSNKFLGIEQREQKRMQTALSGTVSYGTTATEKRNDVQVAGIEKGSKNRYNNIFPYEHSRVRLQNVPSHGCDYVNASYVKASYSNRKYIATQAPVPQTFEDFWKVVWEQEVRVIVMLTAESEGGQVKSHTYWKTGSYGLMKLQQLAERKMLLSSQGGRPTETNQRKASHGRRLTTSNATPAVEKTFNFNPQPMTLKTPKTEEEPAVFIRHLTLQHSAYPTAKPREVIQLQYTQWPDFGAPADPTSILRLVELVDKFQRNTSSPATMNAPSEPAKSGQKPIVVHCSAGCGRTGTFCTVDSVMDMLKRQRQERQDTQQDAMEVDTEDDWIKRDDIDLVAKAVEDFRHQRLSMVQNLRQFVLCYESILQWLHDEKL